MVDEKYLQKQIHRTETETETETEQNKTKQNRTAEAGNHKNVTAEMDQLTETGQQKWTN